MKNNFTFILFLFFIFQITFGQVVVEKEIQGKITGDSVSVEAINVINTTTQKTTLTDKKGFFVVSAKEGDVLIFSAINLESLKIRLNNTDFNSDMLQLQMKPKSIELKEVLINEFPQITAENLRIIPYGQKKYTPAERKVYTATSTSVDALLNFFSGRTKMLKKGIIVEKKAQLLTKLEVTFENKYYIQTLKIPEEYIRGFQYFCIEDDGFTGALQAKNKTLIMFLIIKLAENYNQIIVNEK